MSQQLFLYLASILPLGVAAQWLAWRFRLPSILLLLAFGFLLGRVFDLDHVLTEALVEETQGAVALAPERLLFPFVSLAVAVILFEGGMTLRLSELKQSGRSVLQLCTAGAAITWGLAAAASHVALGMSWSMSLLLGAILVVTGPTVIAPLLRHVRPVRRVAAIAKWEGIVIDPIGALLAVLVFTALIASATPEEALGGVIVAIVKTMTIGG
ncbi:MAG: cation:proton antiporter, partial [Planctomycetales bacterium]|nr:cation:proton antiporter [Planctomycetales bacterium]